MRHVFLSSTVRRLGAALAVLALAGLAASPAAAADVEVKFVEPDTFADVGRSHSDRERAMKALAEHLHELGRSLPPGQTLRIEVTDVDLAGEIDPFIWRGGGEVRVLRGRADWPRLSLRYSLQADGGTLKAGEVQLSDLSYMFSMLRHDRAADELAYEKRMVRRWFNETFAAR